MLRRIAAMIFFLAILHISDCRHVKRASFRSSRSNVDQRQVRKFFDDREALAADMLAEARKNHDKIPDVMNDIKYMQQSSVPRCGQGQGSQARMLCLSRS
eukprot:gnl/MRDRNA2_/MRDRNA2_28816_c0_seq1.p1 gnl/MRDRNA2_/MRDRNA2_28816_c0~~gnl/MRDRNA2_/MRDRNA2_28816_c0_seq1.p1  ORF type:complete len:100 (+),score=15.68 gnl/MRDRNA2_/MRDRNA2_28816_c0_seq1:75-374(+)